jgi:hypothetical protein
MYRARPHYALQWLGLGNLDTFFGRFSRLFLDYFQVKFRLFLDGLVKN